MNKYTPFLFQLTLLAVALAPVWSKEVTLLSPAQRVAIVVNDQDGLHYRVSLADKPVLIDSRLGMELAGEVALGLDDAIVEVEQREHLGIWENPFGQARVVHDNYREVVLKMKMNRGSRLEYLLTVRAYDDGVAFRYTIPRQAGQETFVVTRENTEFVFAGDYRCWIGDYSSSAECQYPEKRLLQLSDVRENLHVLPLLVELPNGYAAVAESDLIDWAGMFLTAAEPASDGTSRPGVRAALATRSDGRGLVVGAGQRTSPWRVVMLAPNAVSLLGNQLIATLATPSLVRDTSWIQPGISAWDAWWTGVNPSQPEHSGVYSRGDTRSHREYIDFAAEMGFRYQLMDWFWYEHMTLWDKGLNSPPNNPPGDFSKFMPSIDVPGLVSYARGKGVGLWIWAHSLDIKTYGMERALKYFSELGLVGIKVDFFASDSQETVQWVQELLDCAARHRLMVDLHGIYKPTGLARTYPNYITQEGVLGNEYNKISAGSCSTRHKITLPFTRGLLGPMDFTPGGFLNRTAKNFRVTSPAEVVGTRARQLAMTVVYPSPFLVLCDSPKNYRGQAGVEFFRNLPTVWDESLVLSAEVAGHVALARRSGSRWYIAVMNGEEALDLRIPLIFLGEGRWIMRSFADTVESAQIPTVIREETADHSSEASITVWLAPAGGFVAVLEPKS